MDALLDRMDQLRVQRVLLAQIRLGNTEAKDIRHENVGQHLLVEFPVRNRNGIHEIVLHHLRNQDRDGSPFCKLVEETGILPIGLSFDDLQLFGKKGPPEQRSCQIMRERPLPHGPDGSFLVMAIGHLMGKKQTGLRAVLPQNPHLPFHDIRMMLLRDRIQIQQRVRPHPVIGITENEIIAGYMLEPRHSRSQGPSVFLRNDFDTRVLISFDHLLCIVGRTIIDDDDLDVGQALPQDGIQGHFYVLAGIIGRYDD